MESSIKTCGLCYTETEFAISLTSNYCKNTDMLEKIHVCLRLAISENKYANICHQCANNVEKFYDFVNKVQKAQNNKPLARNSQRLDTNDLSNLSKRVISSYVREQVIDADYTFSFLEMKEEEPKVSPPFFSYLSPQTMYNGESFKVSNELRQMRTPQNQPISDSNKRAPEKFRKDMKPVRPRHNSKDIFESQSQDLEEVEPKVFDWKLTPDDNIINRVKENFFGRLNF